MRSIILSFLISLVLLPTAVFADPGILPENPTPIQDTFYKGEVIEIKDQYELSEYGQAFTVQDLIVKIKHKELKDKELSIVYEFDPTHDERKLHVGDKVIVGKQDLAGETLFYINDIYRLPVLMILLGIFFVITFLIIGKQTFHAIGGLALSLLVIIYFLVPQILGGSSPFFVSFISALAIAVVSLFWAHGFHIRTFIAFLSTMFTITLALVVAYVFVSFARLSGLGTEEAFFLQSATSGAINLKGLLLGGIIIGTLGILDDITTAQSAAVEEIYKANKRLKLRALYERGLSVGKEHIISLVNTLVLAYTGVALPLLLLFSIYKQPAWVVLNSEIIVEEIIRMLVGSTTLILAVPITTLLAAYIYSHNKFKRIPRKNYTITHHH